MKPNRLLLLFLSLCPLAVHAQTAEVGGAVQDPSGAVIPKASVEFRNQDTGVRRQTTTNNDGYYQITGVDPGKYDATVQAKGFKTLTRENVVFQVGDKAQIDFKMQVGDSGQTVTVDGSGLTINTTDGSVSTVIDRNFVANIPLDGRSFQDLISLTPGVVTQSPQNNGTGPGYNGDFSVNGQRTESNYYTVDGVTANTSAGGGNGYPNPPTSGSVGASTALGTTQSLISVDALQEFRVQSSTYSAEYGRTPGGQFSLETRSGSNAPHGSVFDYLRNNYFDANDWFNDHYGDPIAALRQNDFGGTLGGPIRIPKVYNGTDRSFFFGSYEGLRLTQPQAASIEYVPDIYMRQQAAATVQTILNAFPLQNGIDYGTSTTPGLAQFLAPYSLPSQIDSTSIRLDHSFGPRFLMFFRFGDTPSSTSSRNLSAVSNNAINMQSYTLGVTNQLSDKMTNDFRLGYARANSSQIRTLDAFGGATPIDLESAMGNVPAPTPEASFYLDIPGFNVSSLSTSLSRNEGRQWNIVDTFSYSLGHQQIKVGADYRRINSPTSPTSPILSSLFFSTTSVLDGKSDLVVIDKLEPFTALFDEFALFAQDEWRATPRLSLSLGIRWEVDPSGTEAHGNDPYTLLGSISDPSSLMLAPQGTSLWKTSWFNFAPRLGVAWQAHTQAGWETVLRGGGGIFFDSANELATSGFEGIGFLALRVLADTPLPVAASQFYFAPSTIPPYTSAPVYAFPSHLQLPYTLEWSGSVQQGMGKSQALTLSYVGSNGRRLIQEQELNMAPLNPNFGTVYYTRNHVTSNYQSAQVQFQRSVTRGLHALASYTWSHCLDFGSNDVALTVLRGNCDFDVRNNFQAGASWDIPDLSGNTFTKSLLDHWGLDGRVSARTGFPVTLQGNFLTDPATGSQYYGNLNLVPDQPIYLYGSPYPGGRAINAAAFSLPASTDAGDAPRNFVRGFGAWQVNMAVRREFPIHENLKLQFRAEGFNVLNHPNFGYIDPTLTDITFGQATQMLNQSLGTVASQYQQGGPRSMQFALKLLF